MNGRSGLLKQSFNRQNVSATLSAGSWRLREAIRRAWRASLLAGADHITRAALAEVVAQFMPSTQGLERELQEIAAILECTDSQFLTQAARDQIAADGGRGTLQARMTALKQIVKGL